MSHVPPTRFSCRSKVRRSCCTFSSRRPIAGTAPGASASGYSRGGARHTHSTHSSLSNQTPACMERCGTTAACHRVCGRASRRPSSSRATRRRDPAAHGLLKFNSLWPWRQRRRRAGGGSSSRAAGAGASAGPAAPRGRPVCVVSARALFSFSVCHTV